MEAAEMTTELLLSDSMVIYSVSKQILLCNLCSTSCSKLAPMSCHLLQFKPTAKHQLFQNIITSHYKKDIAQQKDKRQKTGHLDTLLSETSWCC